MLPSIAALMGVLAAGPLAQEAPLDSIRHPLDPLTSDEYVFVVETLSDEAYLGLAGLYPLITLQEPPKEDVLAWRTGDPVHRRAFVIAKTIGQTFEDGEVLVSIQSSPALMPLLQRCGAIVTDEGGIACHAAIISRELRKPTLIGTGFATTEIHTGDLVEVDTYAQVVRILERADSK